MGKSWRWDYASMKQKILIYINSLNISFSEFETIVWNQTQIDEVKKREYLTGLAHNEEVPLQLIKYLSQHCDPIFIITRWTTDVYEKKKTYDTAMFWLRVFLNEEVTCLFPKIDDNPTFLDNIRKMSSPIYSKLIKSLQNF